jgi:hypothetical protein
MEISPKLELSLEIASREAMRESMIKAVDRLTTEMEKTLTIIQDLTNEIEDLNQLMKEIPTDQEKTE